MWRAKIDADLEKASFEYFYWFSRFEFMLKENRFLKETEPGSKAEPSWEKFVKHFHKKYSPSPEAMRLIELHPKRQFVSNGNELEWKRVGFDHCKNALCKTTTMLLTVRNNLFHGGKHGDVEMDDKSRNMELLQISKTILDQLAAVAGYEADYSRNY